MKKLSIVTIIVVLIGGLALIYATKDMWLNDNKRPTGDAYVANTGSKSRVEQLQGEREKAVADLLSSVKYGSFVSLRNNQITLKEFLNLPCFYQFDYILDEQNTLSDDEIDMKYNTKNLPWCSDPSGGTLHISTNTNVTYDVDSNTTYLLIIKGKEATLGRYKVSLDEFTKEMNGQSGKTYPELMITVKGGSAQSVEQLYED